MNLVFMERLKTILLIVFFIIIVLLFGYIVYKDILPNFGFTTNKENNIYKEVVVYDESKCEDRKQNNKFVPFDVSKIKFEKQTNKLNNVYTWNILNEDIYFELALINGKLSGKYYNNQNEPKDKTYEDLYKTDKTYNIDINNVSEIYMLNKENNIVPLVITNEGNLYYLSTAKDSIKATFIISNVQRLVVKTAMDENNKYDGIFAVLLNESIVEITSKIK